MRLIVCALALILAAAPASAADGWHTSLKAGIKAAKQSGKAILYVTAWKPKV